MNAKAKRTAMFSYMIRYSSMIAPVLAVCDQNSTCNKSDSSKRPTFRAAVLRALPRRLQLGRREGGAVARQHLASSVRPVTCRGGRDGWHKCVIWESGHGAALR